MFYATFKAYFTNKFNIIYTDSATFVPRIMDYHRDLSDDEIKEIEKRVNDVVNTDLKVTEEYISREEAKRYYNIDRLPSDTGDNIRIVKIGDYDACPCIGPHINSTEIIGGFRITSKSFEDGVLRIRFKLFNRKKANGHRTR